MSKNLSRKSAALGVVVALATSLFAGAPAQAAGETISLTPSAGTSYKTLLGNSFELSSLFTGWSAAPTKLSYWITGVTAAKLDAPLITSAVARTVPAVSLTTAKADNTTAAADGTTPVGVKFAFVGTGTAATLGQKAQVKLGLQNTVTATTTIKVVAFDDSLLNDGLITAGEIASPEVSITFVKPSEVTAVTTIDAPIVGGTISETASRLVAHVTLPDLNIEQMTATSNVVVDFKDNGTITSNWGDKAALYVAADKTLTAYSTSGTQAQGTVTANHVYSAQAKLFTVNSGTAANAVASASEVTVTSVATSTVAHSDNVLKVNDTNYTIRTGTTAFTITSKVKGTNADGVTGQAVGAGVPVKVTISENGSADIASTITAGGKSLTNATVGTYTDSINFVVSTDALGKVSIPVTSSAGTKDDVIVVKVQALGTSAWVDSADVTYSWKDASSTYTVARTFTTGTTVGVKRGSTYALTYKLTDEFGALVSTSSAITANKRAIRITSSGLSAGSGVAIDQTVEFVDGIATLSVADASTAAATYTLTAKLQQRNSANTAWEDNAVAANVATVSLQTDPTPSYLTAAKNITGKATLATEDFATTGFSFKSISASNTAIRVPTGNQVISGTVLRTDGSAAVGVPVVLSAAGLEFVSDVNGTADQLFAIGSITVYTDETGHYVAKVFSQKAGKATVTVTAGALTKSVVSEWAAPATTDGTTIAITAPAYVAAGSTTTISVKLTDDFGNGVQTTTAGAERFTVTVAGAGISGTIAAQSDADGVVKFYQILGAGDTGTFVITATYDADGASLVYAKITKTATVTIGAAPVVAPVASVKANVVAKTKAFSVSVSGNASAKNVVVKVAGKTVATLKGSASAKTYTVKATKGSKKVTVYVGGKLVATKTVSVK